jgi:signal transduction histidine kinase/DNA-binding response OmpR family regulator
MFDTINMTLIDFINFRQGIVLFLWVMLTGAPTFSQIRPINAFESRLSLANKLKDIKDEDSASTYFRQLSNQAKKSKNQIWEAQILYAQAYRLYCFGKVNEAKVLAEQSASLTNVNDSVTYVKAPLLAAYMLNRQGKDEDALKIAFNMMRKAERNKWTNLLIEAKICIADIYRSINEPLKGLKYAQQAYDASKNSRDTATYLFAVSTLSNLYSNRGLNSPENLEKAVKLYEIIISEPYFKTLSNFSKARHLSNMGRLYENQDRLDLAEKVLLQSIEIAKVGKYKNVEAHALNEMMTIKLDRGQYQKAIEYGNTAEKLLAGESTFNILQRNISRNLTTAYAKLKNFEKAYELNERTSVINDSLAAKEKIEAAIRLDEEYRADKRIIEATANARMMKQERNFIILISTLVLVALIATYRWFLYREKKEADLIAAQRLQTEKLTKLKAKFFTNISHELRTPLTLIAGPIDRLQHEAAQLSLTQQKSYIETIWLNSKKLLTLLNELLDLSKLEYGAIVPNVQTTAVHQFVNSVFDGFKAAAQYKNVRYQLNNLTHVETVASFDHEKVEKILNNLIGNALKFTPTHGKIEVEAHLQDNWLTVKIADTGKGISPEDLTKIFDRYYQVNSDNSSAEGGTGIGLSISKELTELLGGHISVESKVGKGSVFIVVVPIVVQSQPQAQAPPLLVLPEAQPSTQKAAILLVEDEFEMANYISTILSATYEITFANNGKEALAVLKKMTKSPSLIISDIMMPEMDGLSFLKHLKAHDTFCSIPVLMLTAIADDVTKNKALTIGVDDYVTKPFDNQELLTTVDHLIDNLKQRSAFEAEENTPSASPLENTTVSPADLTWLKELETLIRKTAGKNELDIASISYSMSVSERQLFRNIKRITGLTPNKYIRTVRLQMAREAIASGRYKTLAEIAYVTGFETPSYFSKLFKAHYGKDINELLR